MESKLIFGFGVMFFAMKEDGQLRHFHDQASLQRVYSYPRTCIFDIQ